METLARVSRPWLGFIEEWIGLDRPIGGEGIAEEGLAERGVFVRVEEEGLVDERGVEVVRRSFVSGTLDMKKRNGESMTEANSGGRYLIRGEYRPLQARRARRVYLRAGRV